jgi:hypothetical protein
MMGGAGFPSAPNTSDTSDGDGSAAGDGATRTLSERRFRPGAIAVGPCGRHQVILTTRPRSPSAGGTRLDGEKLDGENSTVGSCDDMARMNCAGSNGMSRRLPCRPASHGVSASPAHSPPSEGAAALRSRSALLAGRPSPRTAMLARRRARARSFRAADDRPSSVGQEQSIPSATQFWQGSGGAPPHLHLRERHCLSAAGAGTHRHARLLAALDAAARARSRGRHVSRQ